MKSILSAVLAASLTLSAAPVLADEASSSSSSASPREAARLERCKRFTRESDYERCARIVRRLPARSAPAVEETEENASADASAEIGGDAWKWTNIFNRMEAKIESMIKLTSVMARSFCKDRTSETDTTSRECMARIKDELKTRIERILDEVYRADLPSSR